MQTVKIKNGMYIWQIKEILVKVLEYLENLSSEWNEEKIFIDGEYDSNQTKFELM